MSTIEQLPKITRLLIDASSIIKACCYAGDDPEFGISVENPEGKKVRVNSAQHGLDNFYLALSSTLNEFNLAPFQVVLVLDGKHGNRYRKGFYPGYKGNRKPLAQEQYGVFNEAIDTACKVVKSLGGFVTFQENAEADDVIAYLAEKLQGRKVIWTRDADMLALQSDDVDIYNSKELNWQVNPLCDNKHLLVYKSLVGDASDNLKGAKGFGEKAFEKLMFKYAEEGMDTLAEMLENKTLHELNADEFPLFKKIIDNTNDVYLSYTCAKLYPENALPLTIENGMVEDAGESIHPYLDDYRGSRLLVQNNKDIEELQTQIKLSPFIALDLETSTSATSDKWGRAILAAQAKRKNAVMVDVFGSFICGVGITCGKNLNKTYYIPLRHLECHNFDNDNLADILTGIPAGTPVAIHNTNFELPVIYNNIGGWLEDAVDTQIMASYVDENQRLGLKVCSKHYFDYDQATYKETTGGRKMDELTAEEVFAYGTDDTVVTAALYNLFLFRMETEGTLAAFEQCELLAQYWVAKAFIDGFKPDLDKLLELEQKDTKRYGELRIQLNEYLTSVRWRGSVFELMEALTPVTIKQAAYTLYPTIEMFRNIRVKDKIVHALREAGCGDLATAYGNNDLNYVNKRLEEVFVGQPDFDVERVAHLKELMYIFWELPVRFRTIPTANMRKKGQNKGNPQADKAAIDHALALDLLGKNDEVKRNVLLIIREMRSINTRRGLYYTPYPLLTHWRDGRIHPQLGQSRAATRRFTPAAPNVNQLPKRGEGLAVRGLVKAPEGYLVAAMDWSGQELRLAADASQDPAMLSCYVGDEKDLRDPHSLTGVAIAAKTGSEFNTYAKFVANLDNKEVKTIRGLAKGVNFSSQYLCRAPKLAKLLVVDAKSAQQYLDAKNKAYKGLCGWQQTTIKRAKSQGYAVTRLGARRHLEASFSAGDKYTVAEAERRALNFEIQGSAAEMTKIAISAMVRDGLFDTNDAQILFPVHDEIVLFIKKTEAARLLPLMHEKMTMTYADMTVPLESELSLGLSFGTLAVVGTKVTSEVIERFLNEN